MDSSQPLRGLGFGDATLVAPVPSPAGQLTESKAATPSTGSDLPSRTSAQCLRTVLAGLTISQASGRTGVVLARFVRNERLAEACQRWAFSAISASPGARCYYDAQRVRNKGHQEALRILANRLVGILHGCLRPRQLYGEDIAWPLEELAPA